jgi:hypothetical protein
VVAVTATMVVSLTVVSDQPDVVARAAEVMGRAAAGLALEGIMVNLSMGTPDDDDELDP